MLNTELSLNNEVFLNEQQKLATRNGFGDGVFETAKNNEHIFVVSADLTESVKLQKFSNTYPSRFVSVGIAEQNMVGIASGLALSGKTVFCATHAAFSPSRSWDQIRMSVCMNHANVKIVGSHTGFSNGPDGMTSETLEDIGLMRVLPGMIVISPIDYWQTVKAVDQISKYEGPVYLRISKAETPNITTQDTPFEIGKAYKLTEGEHVTLVATGPIAYEALLAVKDLRAKYNINAELLAMPTIKPLDKKLLTDSVTKTGRLVTIEEHQKSCGLGSAICEMFAESNIYVQTKIMAVNDTFGESGQYKELLDKYALSSHHIIDTVLKMVQTEKQ